jgi:hypothetical protein
MSLLGSTSRMFVGHEQADCAALSANGLFYRCYVWLSRVDWTIEARCVLVQPSGDEVDVFHTIVARASSTEISDTNGVPLDSPKIIAVGTTFVVHWMQGTTVVEDPPNFFHRDWLLHRASMDMTAFSTASWTDHGSVAVLETHMLYDVAPVIGSDTDFVVTRCTALTQINVARYEPPYDWVDTVWAVNTVPTQDVAPMVLGVYAHDADNDVVISYQWAISAGGGLYSRRLDADDGGSVSSEVLMFPQLEADGDTAEDEPHWVQIGHCRVAQNRVAVVGEVQTATNAEFTATVSTSAWIHHIAYRQINSDSAARVGNEYWCPNLHMASRPWSYASGTSVTSPSLDVYCMFTYRSATEQNEWAQAYAYACNLDFVMWGQVSTGQGLRPRPIVTITGDSIGIPDARASGWQAESSAAVAEIVHQTGPTKRRNHVPYPSAAPPTGPDVKTRTVPLPFFTTIGTISDVHDADGGGTSNDVYQSTQPDWAGVRGIVVHMENPWTVYRDSTDPTQPVANFSAIYPRAMHQSVPWGRGLFIAGGTPQLYDGEAFVEVGFPWAPEILDYATDTVGEIGHNDAGNTSSLTDPNGTYSYYVCFSWIDRQGQLHRSAPSNTVTITMPNSDDSVLLHVRCCGLSLKDASAFYPLAQSIAIEVFRTLNVQTVFYRCYATLVPAATIAQAPRNTPVNDPESFRGWTDVLDGASDDWLEEQGVGPYQLDTNNVLVATSGPTPVVWPACHSPALHQNRVVVADALDPTRFIYSDENLPSEGASTYAAPVAGAASFFRSGEVRETTGFASIGNVLYQFTRNNVFALSAVDAGSGLLSWTSTVVHDALGCVDPKTIVLFPLGIGFQSLKGYYVLARSGEASYGTLARSRDQPQSLGGAAIEDDIREAGNIRAASHHPGKHRIDLVCNGEPVVTQTWTFTVDDAQPGTWTLSGLSQAINVPASSQDDNADIAASYVRTIDNLIDADAPDTLQFEVASVTDLGLGVFEIVLLPGVLRTLTAGGPGDIIVDPVAEELETQPWVLRYHYDVEQWSRADLVQTNANTRLSELVDGCYWSGDAGPRHVALAQGGVLIERLPTDALAYADQTSVANVGIPLDITTSWIHFGGLAGYVRIRSIGVLTERDENGAMHVDLEYDRSGALTGQEIQPSTYDWTSPAPAYLRIRPRVQKLSSMRLRLYEDSGVTTAGATVSIVGLVFDVGVLPGMRRVSDAQVGS